MQHKITNWIKHFNFSTQFKRQNRFLVTQNKIKSKTYQTFLEKSAQNGSSQDQFELGQNYFNGENGYLRNLDKARFWVGNAAKQGHIEAEALMGKMLLSGQGVKKNLKDAFRHFIRSSSKGHIESMAISGNMLLNGIGIDQNHNEALKWLRKAAIKGNYRAMCDLGYIYAQGLASTQIDKHIASRLAEKAGNQSETKLPSSQRLAGVLKVAQNDINEAKKWLRKSAHGKDLEGMALLGQLLVREVITTPESLLEGEMWLQKASDLGHKRAQRDLGFLFVDGRQKYGIKKRCKKGMFYLLTAGLFGMPDAYLRAAEVVSIGEPRYPGVKKDIKLAKSYVKDARKTARESKLPTLEPEVWRLLFDDPSKVRVLIDRFERCEEKKKRVRVWFGGLKHLSDIEMC